MQGVLACGLEDQRWIGMEKGIQNPFELKCYEKVTISKNKLRVEFTGIIILIFRLH